MKRLRILALPFFGLAFWRAWVNISFANPNLSVPLFALSNHSFFDLVMGIVFVVAFALARRMPLYCQRPWIHVLCPVLMGIYGLAAMGSLLFPASSTFATLLPLVTISAAVGSALMVLLWSELYAGLAPFKVLSGLTGSYALGAVCSFVLAGFTPLYLAGACVVLPVISVLCIRRALVHPVALSHLTRTGLDTIPWKVILIMVLYSFALSVAGVGKTGISGVNSSLVTFLVAGTLYVCLSLFANRISFGAIQKIPPILMLLGFVLLPLSSLGEPLFMGILATTSFLLAYFFVDTTLCDISQRFGISAIWLFSIEESCSTFAELAGSELASWLQITPVGLGGTNDLALLILLLAVSLVGSLFLVDGKNLKKNWGVDFSEIGALSSNHEREVLLNNWIHMTSEESRLSPREKEVFRLLVEGKSIPFIAESLIISEGTVKSHASHIYEKIGIKNKKELKQFLKQEFPPQEH